MTLLVAQQIGVNPPLTPVYTAVNASDTFAPDDRTFLHVKTVGTGSTVGIATPNAGPGGFAVADGSYVMGTNSDRMIGPLTAALFADPVTGLGTVTYSATTAVTAALIRA
jgi:hypothetical protein